jgi:hypothetical protein
VMGSEISRAAAVSGAAKGFAFRVKLQETLSSSGTFGISGNGTYSTTAKAGQFSMTLNGLPELGTATIAEVATSRAAYLKPPAQFASHLPGGKQWIELDYSDIAKMNGIPGISSLLSGNSQMADPSQFFKYLEADASSVKSLGQAKVDGASTTHYRVVLDLQKAASSLPKNEAAVVSKYLPKVAAQLGTSSLPIDVYIDNSQLIRRMALSFATTPQGTTVHVRSAVQVDFPSYGAQPTPATPPADETINASTLIQDLHSAMSLAG